MKESELSEQRKEKNNILLLLHHPLVCKKVTMDKRNKRFRKRKLLKTEFKLQKFVLPSISLKNSIFLLYPSEA